MKQHKYILVLIFLIFLSPAISSASLYTFDLDQKLPNGDAISSIGTVTISDYAVNQVKFSIQLNSEYDLRSLFFNTTLDVNGISLSDQKPISPAGTLSYSFNNQNSAYKADGDGYFDGYVYFESGTPTLSAVTFVLNYTGLSADDFIARSSGNKGDFILAAQLQGDQGWVGTKNAVVPLPPAAMLLGSGFIGIAILRRKY